MIYFIPSWGEKSKDWLNIDDMIGQIRACMTMNKSHQVIVRDYIPELRYFLHQFDLLESNFLSVYDDIQGSVSFEPQMVRLSDLSFSQYVNFSYTPFSILVYDHSTQVGEVLLGGGSQVLEVSYYYGNGNKEIDIYDDRGFIGERHLFEGEKHVSTKILDVYGEWVFREDIVTGECVVNPNNSRGLLYESYENRESLQFELLHRIFEKLKQEDSIILSVDPRNILEVSKSPYLSKFVLSVFEKRFSINFSKYPEMEEVLKKAKGLIIDKYISFIRLKAQLDYSENIHHLAPYDSRFELSISQELKEEVLYLDSRGTSWKKLDYLIRRMIQYFCSILSQPDQDRIFKVVVRVGNSTEKSQFEECVEEVLLESFPLEMGHLAANHRDSVGENSVDEGSLDNEKDGELDRLALVKQLKYMWEVTPIWNENEIFKIIHTTRLILDLADSPDMFTQISGISAAIPQINSVETEYVKDSKNGVIISNMADIEGAMSYFLDSLRHWQEARAASVQQIKKYSGIELCRKLYEIVGIEDEQ